MTTKTARAGLALSFRFKAQRRLDRAKRKMVSNIEEALHRIDHELDTTVDAVERGEISLQDLEIGGHDGSSD